MIKYMLDTNICIYIIKNNPQKVFEEFEKHEVGEICTSSIVYAELMAGVEKSANRLKNLYALKCFFSKIRILDFDSLAAETYGSIRADLESQGTPIGGMDMLIAAHAKSFGLTIVTHNTREFERVSGLHVEDWG